MKYADFFLRLTGFPASPFQLRVADALLADRSVVLRAPTGSGKTWAVVAPLLFAAFIQRPIADRMLYALPLRSLATSLFDSTLRDTAKCDLVGHLASGIRIQTGETKQDPLFEGLITFTTIDQLLSSYLLMPVGLPQRCGNINAGAVLGSLICFDEFHLLEPERSMATAIEMLNTVTVASPLSRFVLMTATLSTSSLEWLSSKLGAELIELAPDEVRQLPSQQNKVRHYRWIDEPLSAEAVASQHGGRRTIVIANSVVRAQGIYRELCSNQSREKLGSRTQIRLLHSRFFPTDRKSIESELSEWFDPKSTKSDIILVSTQVIEAGLDYSCENLHTEVAPMNAIVQRAGRCARRQGETGTVWCYPLLRNSAGLPAYGAYSGVSSLVDASERSMHDAAGSAPIPMDFHGELDLVNHVHTQWELERLRMLNNLQPMIRRVRKAMDGNDPVAVRELIRDVNSVNVIVTDDPESLDFNRAKWPELLSVPPMSLYRLFETDGADWIAKFAKDEDVQGGTLSVTWKRIQQASDLKSAGWLIAIHPSRATYTTDLGLVVGTGGPNPEIRYRDRPKVERYSYACETYSEHIQKVCAAGTRRDSQNVVTSHRLAKWIGIEETRLRDWLKLIYQLHDVGKLSVDWQDAIWKWQITKPRVVSEPRPPLAHSDFDPATDYAARKYPRPPHAAEGAYASRHFLESEFMDDVQFALTSALTAIVRHHGAFTSSLKKFRLIPEAAEVVAQTLGQRGQDLSLCDEPFPVDLLDFPEELLQAAVPEQFKSLLMYLYFVRRLRIADQNSFSEVLT